MKKILLIIILAFVIGGGIIGSMYMMSKTQDQAKNQEKNEIKISDKVTDDCIEEYDDMQIDQVEEAISENVEKLSPNAIITFEKFYRNCEHTVKKYEKVSDDLVNATKSDIESKYNDWNIKDFSKDKVILYKEIKGECDEHYMLRDINGKINIYKLDENGNESLVNETDIATEYLTSTDMINMENGLIVYGKESLNKLLEDFE